MKTKPAYLVVALPYHGPPRIKRVAQSWPRLEPGEVIVRVSLELPDEVFHKPVVTIPVEAEQAVTAVVEEPEPGEEEAA
jgi:hypothetical protein